MTAAWRLDVKAERLFSVWEGKGAVLPVTAPGKMSRLAWDEKGEVNCFE